MSLRSRVFRADLGMYEEEYFERHYRGYKFNDIYFYAYPIVKALTDVIKPKQVLDAGCARGFHIMLFRELGVEAYGVDISRYAITYPPTKIAKYLYKANLNNDRLPFPCCYFDLVIMLEVVEHLNNHMRALSELKRCLKTGGCLFITTPNPKHGCDWGHINLKDEEEWLTDIRALGLTVSMKERALRKKVMVCWRLNTLRALRSYYDSFRLGYQLSHRAKEMITLSPAIVILARKEK